MMCTVCTTPHNICSTPTTDALLVVVASDQNFPGVIAGGEGCCFRTIRLEDGKLAEITELLGEVFSAVGGLPNSTVVLLGSATGLLQMGSSGYVYDWMASAAKISQRWPTVKVCPLIPIVVENAPGQLFRSVCEAGAAFETLFGRDPRGLPEVWRCLVNLNRENLDQGGVPVVETYTLPFPGSLTGPLKLSNISFRTNISCPAVLKALCRKAIQFLVRVLVVALNRDFSAGVDPVLCNVRITDVMSTLNPQDSLTPPTLIVVGASHMRRTIAHIKTNGGTVVDLTTQGWVLNARNCSELVDKISAVDKSGGVVVVLDLFGNTSYRYKQEDDGLGLAVKIEKGWHMLGDVVPTPETTLLEQMKLLDGVWASLQGVKKIVVLPIPRYAFGGCCANTTHAPNTHDPLHAETILAGHTKHRKIIIKALTDTGIRNMRVLDFVGIYCKNHESTEERIANLQNIYCEDNVHLVENGYTKLAQAITELAFSLGHNAPDDQRSIARRDVTVVAARKAWRGFVSTPSIGKVSSGKFKRGGGRVHPYRR